ncbi:TolC family protein [Pseudomonas gingeri]|uniref:TolC family protein n=1 Tax=Pseudomonas gingeri TaxID=117681 RepID=A0A7Y8CME5_9PSED|nr:TolC family protein [Pseudomonas gingeri]NWB26134.1 TolC family protein [Pseudomonas gingeri]NWC36352.1 TolC family protein [Pseudomonas gingeri]NWD03945.1 TolC family protein [Pseudomonas gingeri]NWD50400.1 TolC family protein [Pseudomonas gingeri]NWE33743.1 TolC family protein [Pseudomonas gingeri]
MFAFIPSHRLLAGVIAVVLGASPWLAVQAEPLSFERAQQLAEHTAPENLARMAQVQSAQSSVGPADALPDPKLMVGIQDLPIQGSGRYSFNGDSMTERQIGLRQEVPNSDKRLARKNLALASVDVAEAEQRAALLEVKRQTALAWLGVYYAERSVSLFDQLDHQVALLRNTTASRIAGGAAPGDLLQADQEALTLADRRDELVQNIATARAKLRRWIGADADQPLQDGPPTWAPILPHTQHALGRHPDLQAATARVGEANAELAEAIAEKKPDWGVELVYGHRDRQFGGDMASLQFTFDLPLFVGSRQGPRINSRQHVLEQREAEQEVMLREHRAELESGQAELDRLKKAVERSQQSSIPLASRRSDLELAAYKAGKSPLNAVISARRELIEAHLREISQQAQLGQLSASLYFAYVEGLK